MRVFAVLSRDRTRVLIFVVANSFMHFWFLKLLLAAMEKKRGEEGCSKPNPRLSASVFSRLLFCWLLPLFKFASRHTLEPKDLYEVLPENLSQPVTDRLEKNWKVECAEACRKQRKPKLLAAIRRTFQFDSLKYAPHLATTHIIFQISRPLVVCQLIWHFDERSTSSTLEAYGYATAFILITISDQMLFNHISFGLRSVGISMRVACASLIYRKIMKLPHSTKQVTAGKIINLLSNDAGKLEIGFLFIHTLWFLPLQTIIITYIIWRNVGAVSLVGVLFLILQTIPVQAFCGKIIAQYRRKIAARSDERLLLTGEIIHGIRIIKMYTWEKPFEQLVCLARRYEIDVIGKASYLKSSLWAIFAFAQRTPLFLTVMTYVLQGNNISAYTMFLLVQYFNVLHVTMGSYFLRAVNLFSEALASIRRIQDFLLLDEQLPSVKISQSNNEDDAMISVNGVSASVNEKSDVNFLRDINIAVRRNFLYAVVGPVGAGKSSLLKLILDELKPSKGEVLLNGDISYASQEPWLFSGTVKNNILFGESYDKCKYDQVTKACALVEDFEQLPNGDETMIAESCVTLSGGQAARVNLARAVYRNADIYLLDDPLSAVDSRVGKRLFEECVNELLKDKTRILVTHQLQYLKEADEIILINDGRVEYQGDFVNFEKTDQFRQLLNLTDAKDVESMKKKKSVRDSVISNNSHPTVDNEDEQKEPEETEKLLDKAKFSEKINGKEESKKKPKVETKQAVMKGKDLYWKYITIIGSCFLPFITLIAFTIAQVLCSGSDYFIAYWTTKQTKRPSILNSTQVEVLQISENLSSDTAILYFGFLMIGIIIMSIVKMALFTTTIKKSNERIHNNMATRLLRATMQFFETNDSGRILNRFSKDLGTADERLQAMMLEVLEYSFITLGVATQLVIINWWLIFVIGLSGFLYWSARSTVVKATCNLMRLENQVKSPVFSHVNSSLAGILTIRSCRAQSMACKQFDNRQDRHTSAAAIYQYAMTAYGMWLDLVMVMFAAVLTYSLVLFKDDKVTGSAVGLALSQALILCGILTRAVKLIGEIETQMISIERLFQYTELDCEDSLDEVGQKPPSSWPSQGKIRFQNVCLRFNQDDAPVLKNLEFTIEAGAKIGIVGRTGAGKSSLVTALFRLAKTEGSIYIDEIDTRKIGLKYLRGSISILPQEPILFSISVRKNLDPLGEWDDASLWSILEDVNLNNVFPSLDLLFNQNSLSTGQRQLLCLARAILRKNRILVLDEATANVDANTDALIQNTIRTTFKDYTVLTIAHRLNTILDCEKILVMDSGRVVEFDSPQELLKKNNGYFSKMLQQNTISAD